MTTASTRRIQSRRDNSRQAAFSFLSNISLGTENAFTQQHNRRVTGVPDTFGSNNLISVDNYGARLQPNTQHFTDTTKSKPNVLRIDTKRSRDPDKTSPGSPADSSYGQVFFGESVFSNGDISAIEQDNEDEPPLWNKRSRSDSVRAQAATSFLSNISLGGKDNRPHRVSKENESVSVKDKTKSLEIDAIIEEEIVTSMYGPVVNGRGRTNSVSSDDTSSSLSLSPSQSPPGSWQQDGIRRMSLVRYGSYNTNNNSYINPTSFNTNFNNAARANQNLILPTISVSPTNTTLDVLSMLKGGDDKTSRRDLRKKLSISENLSRRRAQSYAYLLSPTNALGSENKKSGYDPYDLDDPNISLGKRRPAKAFSSFMGSIMSYSRESDEKREANETFRQKHPQIDSSITLSKIRTIKEKLLAAARNESLNLDLELSTVAMAYSYFEKLIYKQVVDKSNRKVIAAICLFLAVKVNEPRANGLGSLLDSLHKHLDVNEKEIKDREFSVFAALDFALMLPKEEIMPHFERLFGTLEYKSTEEYLGPNPFYTSSGIS